jgi:hypothetical protein
MAITTFAELIAAPASQRDFLLTIEPKERIRSWTKTGGYTYTYEKSWASMFESSAGGKIGKVYRALTRVTQNGAELTARASIALVDANAGSYYYDTAAAKIYVHCSDDGGADRGSVWMVVYFKLYFASGVGLDGAGKIFNAIYYEPIFDPRSVSEITAEQTDLLAGGGMSYGDLTLRLANPWRFFDYIWTEWSWKNAAVAVYYGGESLPLGEYALIYSGIVKEESWLPHAVTFDTVNYLEIFKRNVPVNPCFGSAVRQEDSGKPFPLLFGTVDNISPLCTKADPINATEWSVADPTYQTLTEISAVYDGGTLIAPANYTVDLTNCKFTFSNYTPAGEITCNASGAKLSDIPGESASTLLNNASDIVRFFLKKVLGLADSSLNTTSFAAAKASLADLPLSKYVRFRRNLSSYFAEIERSTLSVIFQDTDGKIGMAAFDPFFTSDDSLGNEEIVSFKQASPASKLYAGVKVYYNAQPFERPESGGVEGEDDSYAVVEGLNTNSRYLDDEETAYRRVVTWLYGSVAAVTIRDRVLFLTNKSIQEYEVEVAGGKLFLRRPGDVLAVSKLRAPTASGTMEAQALQILAITKRLTENRCWLRLDNFAGVAYMVGTWCDGSAPAWGAASDQQRLEQGFWCDSDGLIVAGDWTTADKSVWW